MNPGVDAFIDEERRWQEEFIALRRIILALDVTEEVKWGVPCYSVDGHNVVLMHGFKEYCALLFMKGALLRDPRGILIQQTKNVQAARQIRFSGVGEIRKMRSAIAAYVREAIAIERSGAKVVLKKTKEFEVPEEFRRYLKTHGAVKKAFGGLTPGRQRAYLLYFSAPKKTETRAARIEKTAKRILAGKGLNDE